MKFNKILAFIIALFLFGFLTVDLLMTKYGTKKFYEIKEKNSIIQDSLAEGLIAYKNDHFTFYKWNITSVKEIEHKTNPVK